MMTMMNSFKKEPSSFCFETSSDPIGGFRNLFEMFNPLDSCGLTIALVNASTIKVLVSASRSLFDSC